MTLADIAKEDAARRKREKAQREKAKKAKQHEQARELREEAAAAASAKLQVEVKPAALAVDDDLETITFRLEGHTFCIKKARGWPLHQVIREGDEERRVFIRRPADLVLS